jgi:hypothetical protein
VTSQARTHHERTCGQPKFKPSDDKPPPASGPASKGKAQQGLSSGGAKQGVDKTVPAKEEKDSDGSTRVFSYRGVWMDPKGKYFVKIGGERFTERSATVFFDNVDKAAKKYDAVMKEKQKSGGNNEYNFKSDGTRIIYEESPSASSTGFGGNLDNVGKT